MWGNFCNTEGCHKYIIAIHSLPLLSFFSMCLHIFALRHKHLSFSFSPCKSCKSNYHICTLVEHSKMFKHHQTIFANKVLLEQKMFITIFKLQLVGWKKKLECGNKKRVHEHITHFNLIIYRIYIGHNKYVRECMWWHVIKVLFPRESFSVS